MQRIAGPKSSSAGDDTFFKAPNPFRQSEMEAGSKVLFQAFAKAFGLYIQTRWGFSHAIDACR